MTSTPIMRHASSITDNVNYITTSLRTDVREVNATIDVGERAGAAGGRVDGGAE